MYVVEGFEFESQELAENAKREANGIKYIKSQTRMDDPEVVYKLYNKLLDKDMFVTPVGVAFLKELYDYLLTVPFFQKEDIRQIPAMAAEEEEKKQRKLKKQQEARLLAQRQEDAQKLQQATIDKYKKAFHISTFFAVVFGVVIIGMFVIVLYNAQKSDAENYEEEIINKYESWETELNKREAELNQRLIELQEAEEANKK